MPTTTPALAPLISRSLEGVRAQLVEVAREIHHNPETGFAEREASRRLCDLLEQHGFAVQRGASGMETAFLAERGQGGPEVAFLSEYDALRGIGHACGHNLIGTASAAAGISLASALEQAGLPGRVRVIGSPAEEGGGGKIPLCDDGVFDTTDAALIFHPSDRTFSVMWALACTHWHWAFTGRAAHAAGDPDQGINALDAFVHAYNGIALWRQQLKDGARVHGFVAEGGTAPNVIPERTSGEFITRARNGAYLAEMDVRFRAIFEAAAQATGCQLELKTGGDSYLDLRSNPVLADRCHEHLRRVGLEPQRSIPWDRGGSTDVGTLSYGAPTLQPESALTAEGVSCHTHAFREAADSERAYRVLLQAAEALALTGADVIADGAVREAVRAAFAAQPDRRPEWKGSGH
ncbi:MAG: M20 family metallopeptidase [Candidatus Dormibacteria bacterium]